MPGYTTLKRGKRSVAVHHRRLGNNDPKWMITLCLACHAKVSRTRFLRRSWPKLLIVLWREQHPTAHEQKTIEFRTTKPLALPVSLFIEAGHDPAKWMISLDASQEQATATTL